MEEDEEELKYRPGKGPVRLTWTAKLLIVAVAAAAGVYFFPVAKYMPGEEKNKNSEEPAGVKARTDYRIAPLFNGEYRKKLLELIPKADRRIFVAVQVIRPPSIVREDWPRWRKDRVLKILKKLIRAHKRGIKVKVMMSRAAETFEGKKANKQTKAWLKKHGINAVYNQSSVKLHDKLVIIDNKWILQGSHNWTTGGIMSNREASLLLEAKSGKNWTWEWYRQSLSGFRVKNQDGG